MAFLPGWSKRKKITVSAADVPSAQTDYPLRVQLNDDPDILEAMKPGGGDIRFTAADGVTPLHFNLHAADRLVQRDAAWNWDTDPRGVYSLSSNSTYPAYTNQDNEFEVGRFNHTTGEWSTFTLGTGINVEDDHNNPAICLLADGTIACAYCEHNANRMYFRRTTSAGDISSWGTEVSVSGPNPITYSYAHLFQVPNGDLILFYRHLISGTERDSRYKVSTDGGATWGTEKRLFFVTGERPYLKVCQVGNIIHFCSTNAHPNEIANGSNDIMHYYMDYNDGSPTFHQSDGTLIGDEDDLPLTPADVTLVFDATASGDNAWNWGIAADGSGNVAIVYELADGLVQTNVAPRTGIYRYAYWNGSSWSNHDVASAGGTIHDPRLANNYLGGITIDPDDISRVYYSAPVDGVMQLFEATTADSGASWTAIQRTTGNVGKRIRPFAIAGGHPDFKVVMLNGEYADYFVWETALESWPKQLGPSLNLEADVRIPSLSDSADTEIYVYYGNPSASDASSVANTYPDMIAGWFGDASFQQVEAIDLASMTDLTFESVYKAKAFSNANDETMLSNWTGVLGFAQFLFRHANTTNSPLEFLYNGSGGVVGTTFTDLTPSTGVRSHAAAVMDSGAAEVRGYLHGVESSVTGTPTAMNSSASSTGVTIGDAVYNSNLSFNGPLKMSRIWDGVKSADWLGIMAENLEDPAGFITLGTEEDAPIGRRRSRIF